MVRSLAELRDIHLPPPPEGAISMVDDRLGLLLWIAVPLLIGAIFWRIRRRVLRAALAEIDAAQRAFRGDGDVLALVRTLSRVLRSHAGRRFPESAGLAGRAWLAFLDTHGPVRFSDGIGARLSDLPFRGAIEPGFEPAPLIDLVRRWLQSNP